MESTGFLTNSGARGFTLVEMLVVLTIISVITGIALFGQATFNRSLLLTDTAYTIALSVRQMQSLGLSSKKFGAVQNAGYGVNMAAATPDRYVLFADTNPGTTLPGTCPVGVAGTPERKPGNCLYEAADGVVQTYTFTRGFTISNFCGKDAGNVRRCSSGGYLSEMNIAFLRSDTKTIIHGRNGSNWIPLSNAEIYVTAPDSGDARIVCVSRVGQVSVTGASVCP